MVWVGASFPLVLDDGWFLVVRVAFEVVLCCGAFGCVVSQGGVWWLGLWVLVGLGGIMV